MKLDNNYQQIDVEYDKNHQCLWTYLNQTNHIPCFSKEIISSANKHQKDIMTSEGNIHIDGENHRLAYSVTASKSDNCYSLGGDLGYFQYCIEHNERELLTNYANSTIDILLDRLNKYSLSGLTTISLIQGKCLGGGLEAALTSDLLIAEEQSTFCFPEIIFNLFPGMGAYSILTRKLGSKMADQVIKSGKVYTAKEALELGLIDMVVPKGQGVASVYQYIRKNERSAIGMQAMNKVRGLVNPITREELQSIVDVWVNTAFKLNEHNLSMMKRLRQSQEKEYLPDSQVVVNIA